MKRVALFFAQVAMVIGFSIVVFVVMPAQVYVLVGALGAVCVAGLIVNANSKLGFTLGYVLYLVMLAALFGAFWPALPVIVAWGNVKARAVSSDNRASGSDASIPKAP